MIFGCDKYIGVLLGMKNEYDILDYSKDFNGEVIVLDSYICLVNFCMLEIQFSLMMCCGYSYLLGVINVG